jgi:Flp pilus assembly pilin Flp
MDDQMMSMFHEEAATAVEYGIMMALIAAVIVASVLVLGGSTERLFCDAAESYPASTVDC